jgi:hypothetical protein
LFWPLRDVTCTIVPPALFEVLAFSSAQVSATTVEVVGYPLRMQVRKALAGLGVTVNVLAEANISPAAPARAAVTPARRARGLRRTWRPITDPAG